MGAVLDPEPRFEYVFNNQVTVLEGAEFKRLMEAFWKLLRHAEESGDDPEKAWLTAVATSYREVYPECVVYQEDIRDISTADARKIELFYLAQKWLRANARFPDIDWEGHFFGPHSVYRRHPLSVLRRRRTLCSKVDANVVLRAAIYDLKETKLARDSCKTLEQVKAIHRKLARHRHGPA